jgi:hypothetical protein
MPITPNIIHTAKQTVNANVLANRAEYAFGSRWLVVMAGCPRFEFLVRGRPAAAPPFAARELCLGRRSADQDQHPRTGDVISPLPANVYLHYVLDEWFSRQAQAHLRGPGTLVRYCDDKVAV